MEGVEKNGDTGRGRWKRGEREQETFESSVRLLDIWGCEKTR